MKEKVYKLRANCCYILATIILIISFTTLLTACNSDEFKLTTNITPELEPYGDKIAVQFKLGDLLILDEWADFNAAEVVYLIKKRNKKEPITLKITAGDYDGVYFYYSTGSLEITTKPVTWDILSKHIKSFPNVLWKYKGNVHLNQKKEDIELKPDKANPKTDKLEAL